MITAIRISIVDDHPLLHASIRALLDTMADVEFVAEASNGQGALAAVAVHRPDHPPRIGSGISWQPSREKSCRTAATSCPMLIDEQGRLSDRVVDCLDRKSLDHADVIFPRSG